ncbi:MAG: GNAT family N-acetyltransferase [Candidatus Marinimicrobia bacterium]|nr:GNAT family N-acetyltransferase [Candidatus Neomarinimicrobiota bacterium]MBT3634232.1 GNAT family N-acetyltransferase [Candidatus Neomarinimicrobiota bacterium]MBT3682969.1 GNAT family N-acetyltransferase [Candidatus Neomarinimicrobiota bacterium]MBT3760041.1 GNAT family N-acetyltransferase [Candidatus Neomarinimicrobiota bacterium]MBT3896192.1 GNAT family N-acetyltransferase [Candidatus Neomarinimicrobiota bacterium]
MLGSKRENYRNPVPEKYIKAFNRIDEDEKQYLIVVEGEDRAIIGTLQLSFIQYLTYKGGLRAQIEAVRIRKDKRGSGLGEEMLDWAVKKAIKNGAHLIQLTSDKKRPEAIRFYNKLGFTASHEGMKLHLEKDMKG